MIFNKISFFLKKIVLKFIIVLIIFKIFDLALVKFLGIGDPIYYQFSKILGYELKPNQTVIRKNKKIIINNLGMRSSYDWENNNKKKILFIGDSVTYGGSIINNNELFSEKTCQNLDKNKYMCGNYAVNGYGIESIIRKIKFRDKKDEDLLIIVITSGSLTRGINHITTQPFWSKKINDFFPALSEITIYMLGNVINKIKFDFIDNSSENINELYIKSLLLELKTATEDNNKNTLIIFSPEYDEVNKKNNTLLFLKQNFKYFIDMSGFIKNINTIYHDHLHLNKDGHDLYANTISKFISENSIFKKNIK